MGTQFSDFACDPIRQGVGGLQLPVYQASGEVCQSSVAGPLCYSQTINGVDRDSNGELDFFYSMDSIFITKGLTSLKQKGPNALRNSLWTASGSVAKTEVERVASHCQPVQHETDYLKGSSQQIAKNEGKIGLGLLVAGGVADVVGMGVFLAGIPTLPATMLVISVILLVAGLTQLISSHSIVTNGPEGDRKLFAVK